MSLLCNPGLGGWGKAANLPSSRCGKRVRNQVITKGWTPHCPPQATKPTATAYLLPRASKYNPLGTQGLLRGRSSSQHPMCKGHLCLIQKPHGSRKQDQKGQPGNLERALMQVSQQACPRSSCSSPATASAIFFFF